MLSLALGLSLLAASPTAPFTHRAQVQVEPAALPWVRLPLPDEVLSRTKADLSDVRVVDADGKPVAWKLLPRAPSPRTFPGVEARVRSVSGDPEQPPRGGRVSTRRTFELELPPLPPGAARWRLELQLPEPRLMSHGTLLRGGTTLAEGILFRLPAPASELLSLELPEGTPPGPLKLVTVTEGPVPLEAQFSWVPLPSSVPRDAWRQVPALQAGPPSPGRTVLALERPSGVVPSALELSTSTPTFSRRVSVEDVAPSGMGTEIASGMLSRVAGGQARLQLPLRPASGTKLVLYVEDGDAAPLEQVKLTLIAERPTLLFSLAESQRARPLQLYFGGGLTRAPRYDLAALSLDDAWASTAERPSSLGPVEPNPAFIPAAAVASFVRAGEAVPAESYASRRALTFQGGAGPWNVQLDVQDAALLRAGAADARVVDAEGRQWPWGGDGQVVELELRPTLLRREGTTSVFSLPLPASTAQLASLSLEPTPYLFERAVHLESGDESGRREVLLPTLLRRDPTNRAGGDELDLSAVLPAGRVRTLEMFVKDGQERPLEGLVARAGFRVPVLQVFAPPGSYTLLLGSPRTGAPRYDLKVVQAAFEELAPIPVSPGPLEPNPAYRPPGPLGDMDSSRLFLWGGLLLAVLVLGGLALRLARQLPG